MGILNRVESEVTGGLRCCLPVSEEHVIDLRRITA